MLVKEKYAKELIEFAIKNGCLAVDKNTKQLCSCDKTNCVDCLFFLNCNTDYILAYFNSKYTEELQILSDVEYALLKNINEQYKYITRDEDGNLYVHEIIPYKRLEATWRNSYGDSLCYKAYNHLFKLIEWEEDEPYLIENLIKQYEASKGKENEI